MFCVREKKTKVEAGAAQRERERGVGSRDQDDRISICFFSLAVILGYFWKWCCGYMTTKKEGSPSLSLCL